MLKLTLKCSKHVDGASSVFVTKNMFGKLERPRLPFGLSGSTAISLPLTGCCFEK